MARIGKLVGPDVVLAEELAGDAGRRRSLAGESIQALLPGRELSVHCRSCLSGMVRIAESILAQKPAAAQAPKCRGVACVGAAAVAPRMIWRCGARMLRFDPETPG
jgi:hypothetical protein